MTLKLNGTTSGSVSLDAPATGSDISFTLPGSTGTNGQLLSTNGSGVLSFVNGGKILQIVRASDTTNRSTTSATFVDVTGMSVTITPQKSDSAVMVISAGSWRVSNGTDTDISAYLRITDSANNVIGGVTEPVVGVINLTRSGTATATSPFLLVAWATPATTSAVTYKLRFSVQSTNTTFTLRNATDYTGQMYAIEVSA